MIEDKVGVLIYGMNRFAQNEWDLLQADKRLHIQQEDDLSRIQEGGSENKIEILLTSSRIDKAVLDSLPDLKYLLATSSGTDHIDLAQVKERNILFDNCPNYCTISVAEHALGLMLAVSRRISEADHHIKSGGWDTFSFLGNDLYGKTLGIIGLGRIGRRIAEITRPLGVTTLGINSTSTFEERRSVMEQSDYICVSAKLNETTRGMMDEDQFSLMKEGVRIINISRGSIIDEKALLKYVQNGKVAGAGLDVFEEEPLALNHPLRSMVNVVLTPHIAVYSKEAMQRLSKEAYNLLLSYVNSVRNA